MKRLVLVLVAAVAGCGGDNGNNGGPDMSVSGGNDMTMVMTTTIAQARMGNVQTPITVNAVVIAINGMAPDAKEWYIQDPAGGAFSAVSVYCNKTAKTTPCPMSVTVPALHDLIQITGKLSTFKGKVELQPTGLSTMMANAAVPAPMTATAADLVAGSTNAGIRGGIVKLTGTFTVDNVMPQALYNSKCAGDAGTNGLCSGCRPPTYGGFEVNDGSSHAILVEQTFYNTDHLQSSPECVSTGMPGMQVTAGKTFSMLGGIVDVDPFAASTNTVVLEPTADTDYTLQ